MNNQKFRVVFLTDSLSLPRDVPEKVSYEETFVYLLKQEYPNIEFIQFAYGGATISDLRNQADYLKSFSPNILILQAGIVDCAPRTITRFESDFISRIPFLSKFIFRILKNNASSIRKTRRITYTNPRSFEENLKKINSMFNDSRVYAIGILPASLNYERKVPKITSNILLFNEKLKSVFRNNFIDTSDFDESYVMSDFFHLNKKGHLSIYKKLNFIITSNSEIKKGNTSLE
ncbi:MAG: SGNH/GDSL hydrolase family protein [Flavobacteriales bacterium]|nr:SGNH/GDSL hydrolase family protein [Flavobacteriales bacterium]